MAPAINKHELSTGLLPAPELSDSKFGTPLEACFNLHIRPLLDSVDKLRSMGVIEEGIELPTIVVVGDQSSGKSSVLESLAGVSLPRGQGIVTRVPLILRLQTCTRAEDSQITLEYEGKSKKFTIVEEEIQEAVNSATTELAGNNKDIVDKPISLHIRKPDAPDLTMVDLPGITRVPVHGQPDDIYEQIKKIITKYIRPQQTIILNVLSATVDFATCESICMSQQADKLGERTLAVVTKVDRAPEGLYEKVTTDAVNIGLGYVCVRNRTDDEKSHEEARATEQDLFEHNVHLSRLNKDMVGVPVLARRLTQIQAESIKKCLPGLVKQINFVLASRRKELQSLPQRPAGPSAAGAEFMKVLRTIRKQLEQLMAGKFVKFPEDKEMHYTARLHEFFLEFSKKLSAFHPEFCSSDSIATITESMQEARGVNLPNFLPQWIFQQLIDTKMEDVSGLCLQVVQDAHAYALQTALSVVDRYTQGWPKLCSLYKREVQTILSKSQSKCEEFVKHKLEKESRVVFTYDSCYMDLMEKIRLKVSESVTPCNVDVGITVDGIPGVKFPLTDLKNLKDKQILEMIISLIAYWKVVQIRLADEIPLELIYTLERALVDDLEDAMLKHTCSKLDVIVEIMEEDSQLSMKRERLLQSLDVLGKCSLVVAELLSSATTAK